MDPVTMPALEEINDNVVSFNSVIRNSYSQAKKHLHDGFNVIKDEFIGICDKAESYFNIIAQPVNNFLKDLGQIEAEFEQELNNNILEFNSTSTNGNIIPIDQALKGCMEENY